MPLAYRMNTSSQGFLGKLLAAIFGLVAIALVCLIGIIFFVPKTKINHKSETLPYSQEKVWAALSNKKFYLSSKKEIEKYRIVDSLKPRWIEYYTANDSVENITTSLVDKSRLTYAIVNRKYQQVNAFSFRLNASDSLHTQVDYYELSRYFNAWGAVYFQLFYPNTVIDYEMVKLRNTLQYIDSLHKI